MSLVSEVTFRGAVGAPVPAGVLVVRLVPSSGKAPGPTRGAVKAHGAPEQHPVGRAESVPVGCRRAPVPRFRGDPVAPVQTCGTRDAFRPLKGGRWGFSFTPHLCVSVRSGINVGIKPFSGVDFDTASCVSRIHLRVRRERSA